MLTLEGTSKIAEIEIRLYPERAPVAGIVKDEGMIDTPQRLHSTSEPGQIGAVGNGAA